MPTRDWRGGSVVKSIGCSSRGPRFNSQQPHGSSQLSLTLIPGDLTPSHRHTYAVKTPMYTIKNKLKIHFSVYFFKFFVHVYMRVCASTYYGNPGRPKENARSPGVRGDCELPGVGAWTLWRSRKCCKHRVILVQTTNKKGWGIYQQRN